MSKQREALQVALQALEEIAAHYPADWESDTCVAAKRFLREALAEPEQEPVAWITGGGQGELWWYQSNKFDDDENLIGPNPDDIPLYAAPPARKPLTDYQIREIDELVWKELSCEEKTFGQFALKMARAIERAHGIGND